MMSQELNTTAPEEQFKEEDILENTSSKESLTEYPDHSSKSLKEIVQIFQELLDRGDQQEMYKYAEGIKAAFYKALKREKIAAGFHISSETTEEHLVDSEENLVSNNPFAELERGFKELYSRYKTVRISFLQTLEKNKEENLHKKNQIIDELKSLLEKQEDLHQTFPAFRELQNRWKSVGPVPQANNKDTWDTYQYLVEKFYDFVKINNELRDLDLKKNLEIKIELCNKAETLVNEPNIVVAFRKLQKLHEEWRDLGPVSKEQREEIWERFKKATSNINKRQQDYFEGQKDDQKKNLDLKAELCEKVEAIANIDNDENKDWNTLTKEIEQLQNQWKNIGFASKKDNQRIYDRFRAACDKFYNSKREHYSQFKGVMQENLDLKISLCEQAEALKDSQDWKKTTDLLINLQKRWKEIGPVARKQSDIVWKRFRAACDAFFDNKAKHFSSVDDSYEQNLQKKLELVQEITDYKIDTKASENAEALKDFQSRWSEIGFVPIKDKERIQAAYRHAIETKFGDVRNPEQENRINKFKKHIKEVQSSSKGEWGIRAERDKLVQRFRQMESDIAVWENNIGFFAKSKNADSLLIDIEKKIVNAKEELAQLEEKIKLIDKQNEQI
ncbi:MAG: DUF349 domain-containing protein [Bacteroidales bacterium]|jgi:hypothetical protein